MKKISESTWLNILFLCMYLATIVVLIFAINGCSSQKKIHQSTAATEQVNKIDSGAVSKTETTNINESEWWREYVIPILEKQKEPIVSPVTNTEKILQPINNNYTQPILIREGGKQISNNTTIVYDSSWKKAVDSLQKSISEINKEKKTDVLSFWQIIAIGLAAGVVVAIAASKIPFPKIKIFRV